MKKTLLAFSDPENKRINPLSNREFISVINSFGQGTKITVTIENYVRKKTPEQLSYIHVVFRELENETGMDREDIKMAMKARYGLREALRDRDGNEVSDEDGEVIERLKSLSEYSKQEMSEFIDNVLRWAREFLGVTLPDPEDYKKYNLKW